MWEPRPEDTGLQALGGCGVTPPGGRQANQSLLTWSSTVWGRQGDLGAQGPLPGALALEDRRGGGWGM